jgi:hypothetical protein
MSPYAAGRRVTMCFAIVCLCWLAGLVVAIPPTLALLFFAFLLVVLLCGAVASFFIRCPVCRTSVFMAHKGNWVSVSRPWPSKRCCDCHNDLKNDPAGPR